MSDNCICRKLLTNPKALVIWGVYLIGLLIFLSLVIGSYQEYEPKAGMMFGVFGAIYAVIFGLLAWRMTRLIKR